MRTFLKLATVFLSTFIFSGCENFLTGSVLRDRINEEIMYANSSPINIRFNSKEGKISPNGIAPYKITDKIYLSFTEDQDFQFIRWQVLDQDGNDVTDRGFLGIESPESLSTTAIFKSHPETGSLCVTPLCVPNPKVLSYSPMLSSDGAYRDSRIAVSFDREISPYSIYYTDEELEELDEAFELLYTSYKGERKYYGYKTQSGKIVYKNISITNKRNGENLLENFSAPSFEGDDTFILRTNPLNAPKTGSQIVVELKDFFYDYDGQRIKISASQKWQYSVNSKTDRDPPELPDSNYFIRLSAEGLSGNMVLDRSTAQPSMDNDSYKSVYIRDGKIHLDAQIFDMGSGVAPNGYSGGRLTESGFYAEFTQIRNALYETPSSPFSTKVLFPIDVISSNAYCNCDVDLAELNIPDGIYRIVFYAMDQNGNLKADGLRTNFILIDNTAPKAVQNIHTAFSNISSAKTYTVNWDENKDPDFDHYIVQASSDTLSDTKESSSPSYTVNANSVRDKIEFTFSITAVDIFGNRSEPTTVKDTPEGGTVITKIELSKDHFNASLPQGNKVTVKAFFSKINSSLLQICLKEKNGTEIVRKTPSLDQANGFVHATFDLPKISLPTELGEVYEVYLTDNDVILRNEKDQDAVKRLVATKYPTEVKICFADNDDGNFLLNSRRTVKIKIEGKNLDLWSPIKVRLTNTDTNIHNDFEAPTTSVAWFDGKSNTRAESVYLDLMLPTETGHYKLELVSDFLYGSATTGNNGLEINIFDSPKLKSLFIPQCGVSKAGNEISVLIKGENFNQKPDLTLSSTSNPEITRDSSCTVIDDTTISATIKVPASMGDYEVVAKIKDSGQSISSYLTVTNTYQVGDLILSDGKKIDYRPGRTNFKASDFGEAVPVAVIFDVSDESAPLGVGVHSSQGHEYQWAKDFTDGYTSKIYAIKANKQGDNFTVETRGRYVWDKICESDPKAKEHPENYPAFNFALTYGTRNHLPEFYRNGWYLPDIIELSTVHENVHTINEVIKKIPADYGANEIGLYEEEAEGSFYWAANQSYSDTAESFNFDFIEGYGYSDDRSLENNVCPVRIF